MSDCEDLYVEALEDQAEERVIRWNNYLADVEAGKADPKSHEDWLAEDEAEFPELDYAEWVDQWNENMRYEAADRALAYRKENPGA